MTSHKYLLLILLCLGLALPALAQDELDTHALEALLDDYVAADDPAVVLFVSMGDDAWVGVRGLADLDSGEAATVDDLFRIGSTTKPLVATAMLMLADAGDIDLDDPIADYLPDEVVANVANADTATIRQMLQMTSGIFSYTESDTFGDAVDDDTTRWWTPAETITYIYGEEPYFAPGEGYYYSNSNYNLAQMIIESIMEAPLAEVLQEAIFDPLGMETCYLETEATFAQNIVRGYGFDDDNQLYDMTEINDGVGLGDGGVICAAADLAKFPEGLIEELLSDEMLEEMATTVDDGEGGQYGLGIGYDEGEFGEQIGHDGATSGFQSNMVYLIEDDITVVILTNNFDSDLVEDLTLDAQAIALGE